METDILIIGAGLTGLSAGVELKKRSKDFMILEKSERVGGQIHSYSENGFLFESGPTTGSGASDEVMEMFSDLESLCEVEFAKKKSEKRLIWKNGKFHALPSGLISAVTTPLFNFSDKIRILGEPFRKKGNNPDESVASLTKRRLGKSFLAYAVDPFLSGIYAGNPETLVTRHALPKLYNLEQNYGSFIGGSIAKAKEAKKNPPKNAKKGIFSAKGGLESLPKAMAQYIGSEKIILSADNITILPENGKWKITYQKDGENVTIISNQLISTIGSYNLPQVFPFIEKEKMNNLTNAQYAPVIQVAVGMKDKMNLDFNAFGALFSSKDKQDFLGILFPSSCFTNRSPEDGVLFSFFMGGMKRKDIFDWTDTQITETVTAALHTHLGFPKETQPALLRIFRHKYAIPQYEKSSDIRFETIRQLETEYKGLHIAGNLRDGIGMAHRIIQGINLGKTIGSE